MIKKVTKTPLSDSRIHWIVWSLLALAPVVGMAVDLITPSMPAISENLMISHGLTKAIIFLYLLGYALGNFISGFLTDAFGRQKFVRIGLLGFVIASLLPVFFPHISSLLLARTLQGIMIGIFAVASRAIYADLLSPKKLMHIATLGGTMFGLGPILGPVIGGYLQFYFNWQACFIFFAMTTFLGLLVVFFMVPETLDSAHRQSIHPKALLKNFKQVLNHPMFLSISISMGCVYSLMISFHTLAPFFIEIHLNYSPIFFGHLALILGCFFLGGTFISRGLLKKYSYNHLFFIGVHFFFSVAIVGLIFGYFYRQNIDLLGVLSSIMFFACGLIFPMSMGKCISYFKHIGGTAGAFMFLINLLFTSLVSFLLGFVNISSVLPILWIYVLLLLVCLFLYWGVMKKEKLN